MKQHMHPYLRVKRIFDFYCSLFLIIILSPLLLVIASAIKCSSCGTILYKSRRIGLHNKEFWCLKFRTMYKGSDFYLNHLMIQNDHWKEEWKTFQKIKNDPRITPVGRFLRKFSFDELPQLFNVIRGDMSLVGPRPLTKEEVVKFLNDKAPKILSVPPGITGLWQTSGRNLIPMNQRMKLEEKYVDMFSFKNDFILICKTIPAIIKAKGAY
ncbi:MAG: sugar transferase [Parachlamydiales bacterium]|nr:sugar transferase [Parachlamydiales bacterium]